MPAPGALVLLPTICCGVCGTVDAWDVAGYTHRRLAAAYFTELGWRMERPDSEHKDPFWSCPVCSGVEVKQAEMAEPT